MDGFWDSVSIWLKEKTSSPLYFTYIAFFVAWNWKFFQLIFLEDASAFSTPRIEYIDGHLLFSFSVPWVWHWIAVVCVWLANALWHVLPPAIFTFLSIKYLPMVHKWAFGIYVKNHFERKRMYREADLEYQKEKTVYTKEVAKEKKEQAKQKSIIKKSQTQEERWDEEYEDFKKDALFQKFQQIVDVVYTNKGETSTWAGAAYQRLVGADILALAHAKGLVEISNQNSDEKISFTEKGRYFVKRYLASEL